MPSYELSLSPKYVMKWTFRDAIREIFQNAMDQEVEEPEDKMNFGFSQDDNGKYMIVISNKLSKLSKSSLLLGNSTKTDSTKSIGKFGEGYKLALVVLLRLGCKVEIINYANKEKWVPEFTYSRKYESRILTVNVTRFRPTTPPEYNLSFTISNITLKQLKEWREFNLISNVNYEKFDLDGREVLTEPKHKGLLYVRGLFISKSPIELEYGYNFLPEDIQLDRDRGLVDTFSLTYLTSRLWSRHEDRELVLDMTKRNTNDVQYLKYHSSSSLSNIAYEDFILKYGNNVVPVTDQSQAEGLRNSGYTGETIIVNENIYSMIGGRFDTVINSNKRDTPSKILQDFFDRYEERMDLEMYEAFKKLIDQSTSWSN